LSAQRQKPNDNYKLRSGHAIILLISRNLPFIQYLHTPFITSIENPYQVGEYMFPDTKFEFMKEIWGKHLIKIETEIT
jgi:hypothetical protein